MSPTFCQLSLAISTHRFGYPSFLFKHLIFLQLPYFFKKNNWLDVNLLVHKRMLGSSLLNFFTFIMHWAPWPELGDFIVMSFLDLCVINLTYVSLVFQTLCLSGIRIVILGLCILLCLTLCCVDSCTFGVNFLSIIWTFKY